MDEKKLRKLKDQVAKFISKDKPAKALDGLQQLARAEPNNARWQLKMGESFTKLGQPGRAVDAFRAAARRYAEDGFLLKAIAMCNMILGIDPDHSETQAMLANLYAKRYGTPPPAVGATPVDGARSEPRTPGPGPDRTETETETETGPPDGARPAGDGTAPRPAPTVGSAPAPRARVEAGGPGPSEANLSPQRQQALEPASSMEQALERVTTEVVGLMDFEEIDAPTVTDLPSAESVGLEGSPTSVEIEVEAEADGVQIELGGGTPGEVEIEIPSGGGGLRAVPTVIPRGEALDAVTLGDVVPEAREEPALAPVESKVFEIPLGEELDAAFDEAFDEDAPAPPRVGPRLPPTPLFSSLDEAALRALIERVAIREFSAGETIIRQGETGQTLYVIVDGEVAVCSEGTPRIELNRLGEGAFFGEIALLTRHTRTSTVQALQDTTVIEISRDVVASLLEDHPAVLKVLLRFFRYRLIDTLIETSELFQPFSETDREELAFRFRFLEAPPDTVFVQEGKQGDGLYVLLSGQLEVTRRGGVAGALQPGELFGVTSLLMEGGDVFTVRALTKCWLLKLDQSSFREVIMTHPSVLAYTIGLAEERRAELAGEQTRPHKVVIPVV